jgi:hypothetical protein
MRAMSSDGDNSEINFLLYTLELTGKLTEDQLYRLKSAVHLVSPNTLSSSQQEDSTS